MTISPPEIEPSELKDTFRLLFRMRRRFRIGLPENIADLKKRIIKNHQGNLTDAAGDFDMFYSIGIAMDDQPEALTMGDLSRKLNVPLSTATRIVDWLVTNGYAERLPDADDRRVVRVVLTAAGRAMYHEIDGFFMERIQRLFRNFDTDERKTFQQLLSKIVTGLEQES